MNKLLPKADLYTRRIIAQPLFLFTEKSGAGPQQVNLFCSTWDREDFSSSLLLQPLSSVRIFSGDFFLSERALTSSLFLYRKLSCEERSQPS